MNSSINKNAKTLARISQIQAETFLLELANLGDDTRSIERFRKRFYEMIPQEQDPPASLRQADESFKITVKQLIGIELWELNLLGLRDLVRLAWRETDLRTKEYILFLLQQKALSESYKYTVSAAFSRPLPPPNQFEQSLIYLRKSASIARFCGNPECNAPYFFAKRRSQKYCSEECAEPAQREYKRQWWAVHGEEWRAARKEASKAPRSNRQKARK
jgi:hypothetical protein